MTTKNPLLKEKIHIDQVKNGDVIFHEGEERTVNNCNIKYSPFMSTTVFGDSYNLGNKPVIKISKGK